MVANPNGINGTTNVVFLQFSFSKADLIPRWLYDEKKEVPEQRAARKTNPTKGTEIIPCTPRVDASGIAEDLENAGFVLVDAFHQERLHGTKKDGGNPMPYHMVRFAFARERPAGSKVFCELLDQKAKPALHEFLKNANWRVRAYRNPSFKDGVPLEGISHISINLEVRDARVDRQGRPIRNALPTGGILYVSEDYELRLD